MIGFLDSLHGATLSDKIGVTELNNILLNNIPNSWSNKAYVQGFDFESILYKKYVIMFEQMEISESIYKGVVDTSYKKPTQSDANCAGHSSQMRLEDDLSQTHPTMGESSDKRRKIYVYRSTGEMKTCLIHIPGHSSDECKVLVDFCANYAKGRHTKDHNNYPVPRRNFNRRKGNNAIINNVVDEILPNETQKVSTTREALGF